MTDLYDLHARLVARLDTTEAIRAAFADHPRHRYVPDLIWPDANGLPLRRTADPERWVSCVYAFAPVTTQADDGGSGPVNTPSSSSSHPQVMADMIRAARVGPGDRVLEIGTGTGWNAAILSSLVGPTGSVTSVEIDPDVAAHARGRLDATGVRVVHGAEIPEGGYDAIIATCAVSRVPEEWIASVPVGAPIVVPWAPSSEHESTPVAALRVRDDGSAYGPFVRDAVFMHDRTQRVSESPFPGIGAEPEYERRLSATSDALIDDRLLTRLMLMLPGVRPGVGARPFEGDIGRIVHLGTADASWAYVWPDGTVTGGGERDLFGELAAAYDALTEAGRPPLETFSLEVDPKNGVRRVRAPDLGVWEHR
ncbi:methyltransferase domain-containing protein [Nocardiopsis alba]|uniref:methyltransferase domain-containing protein n=1 Tax=Nocardiopsis alba TaxID=53437 RepID=UPI00034765E2|nr:methyltransferase domain-containing protein [Nocardiopsis alba]